MTEDAAREALREDGYSSFRLRRTGGRYEVAARKGGIWTVIIYFEDEWRGLSTYHLKSDFSLMQTEPLVSPR